METTLLMLMCLAGVGQEKGEDPWKVFPKLSADRDPDRRVQAIEGVKKLRDLKMAQAVLPLLGDDHPRVRARAVAALRPVRDGAVAEYLAKTGLRHPKGVVRREICEILGGIGEKATVGALLERLEDSDPAVRGAAAAALGKLGDPSTVEALISFFLREKDGPARAAALESMARLDSAAAAERIAEAARAAEYPVRIVAAELAREGDVLSALVHDRDWRVRAAAIEACRGWRHRPCVGWLVEQLGAEKGRLRWDILVALKDLTGKDLGLDPKPWMSWWEANRETLDVRAGGGKEVAAEHETHVAQVSFFDLPILSTNLLFILDLSGSMRDPSPAKGGASPATKLDVAKKGMTETIRVLPAGTRFGILGLGADQNGDYARREQKTWQRRLALWPASPAAKADAEKFVRGLEAWGWTNIYDAVEYSFSAPDVDTVYLYSDGGASKGVYVASDEILEQVRKLNRFRKIVIHTVEVPGEKNTADNRRLLRDLARVTGGQSKLQGPP